MRPHSYQIWQILGRRVAPLFLVLVVALQTLIPCARQSGKRKPSDEKNLRTG
jgi:hypothetical protein